MDKNSATEEPGAAAGRGDWRPDERDAESVEDTAYKVGLSRAFLYQALHPDPKKRGGLPFLPSLKVGKRRLIRAEARRAWLQELEQLAGAKSAAA